jgi:FAD/FMN-containing dehydrogenase
MYALVEALGADAVADRAAFERMLAGALDTGLVTEGVMAQSPSEVRDLWRVRDLSGEFPRLLGASVGYDLGIPIGDIGRFVDACGRALRERWPAAKTAFFGHIGDSNLHLNLVVQDGAQPQAELDAIVYGLVREWRGTISAEHGIGLLKRPYLGHTRTAEEIVLFRAIKHALDPKGILNPGKILEADRAVPRA